MSTVARNFAIWLASAALCVAFWFVALVLFAKWVVG